MAKWACLALKPSTYLSARRFSDIPHIAIMPVMSFKKQTRGRGAAIHTPFILQIIDEPCYFIDEPLKESIS